MRKFHFIKELSLCHKINHSNSISLQPNGTKILAFKLKILEISKRNPTTFSITLISHKETNYEETYLIKVVEIYVLCNIAAIHYNSFVGQFGSIGL